MAASSVDCKSSAQVHKAAEKYGVVNVMRYWQSVVASVVAHAF